MEEFGGSELARPALIVAAPAARGTATAGHRARPLFHPRRGAADLRGDALHLRHAAAVLALSQLHRLGAGPGAVRRWLCRAGELRGPAGDPVFIGSLAITFGYTAAAVAAQMVLGLAIALLLNIDLPYMRILRTALVVPMMITPIVGALCWKLLLDPSHGLFNYWIGQKIVWLGMPDTALAAVWVVNVWQSTPYVALILLAGLRSLPSEPLGGGRDRRRQPVADVLAHHAAAAAAVSAGGPAAADDFRVPRLRQHLRPDRRRAGERDDGAVDVHLSDLVRALRLQPGRRGIVDDAADVDADVPVLHRGDPPAGRALMAAWSDRGGSGGCRPRWSMRR